MLYMSPYSSVATMTMAMGMQTAPYNCLVNPEMTTKLVVLSILIFSVLERHPGSDRKTSC